MDKIKFQNLKLNLADWIDCTEAEGPGKRFGIWVQGCLKKCPACCNPHMFPIFPNKIITVKKLWQEIKKAKEEKGIEGLTFLGGEPFLQAVPLSVLAKKAHVIGLSVIVFSGYTYKELLQKKEEIEGVEELLKNIDVLIDGEFQKDNPDFSRKWIGSLNQQLHFFSDVYKERDFLGKEEVDLEIRIKNDKIIINGNPFCAEE